MNTYFSEERTIPEAAVFAGVDPRWNISAAR